MRLTLVILTIGIFLSANAQEVEFSLKKIEDISSQLPAEYFTGNDTLIPCPDICANKSIVILHNEKGQISHVGISMFSREMKEIINLAVCDFIERFLLELALEKDEKSIISMLDHYRISLRRNGLAFGEGFMKSISEILRNIEEPAMFTLNKKGVDLYAAVWEYGVDNILVLEFPSNRELILGTNKKESDDILHVQLKDNYCNDASVTDLILPGNSNLVLSDNPSVFISKGDTFMLKMINEDTYYKKTNKGYELIFDRAFPKESLSNLFYGFFANNSLKLHVKHSIYGNFTPEFEMKFADFICYFKNDFKVYTASFLKGEGEVHSTIVFQNIHYNYIHLLTIKTTEDSIFNKNSVIAASFHSNIPQHNISNLVGDMIKQ